MAWTRTGTISLTNGQIKVYGIGTPWVSNGKTRPGDALLAPDGKVYEISSIESNTELTLTDAYLGATASGQAYKIQHLGLLPAELAVGISDLQSKYLTTIAQLYEWETSEAATVPITNPATGVTVNVKPLKRFLSALGDGSMAGSFTDLVVSGNFGLAANGRLLLGATSSSSVGIKIGSQFGGVSLDGGGGSYANWGGTYGIFPLGDVGLGVGSAAAIAFIVDGGTEAARIDRSGNLLFGTTTFGQPDVNGAAIGKSDGALRSHHSTGSASGQLYAYFTYGGMGIGSITQVGTTSVAYNTTSDYRLKNNVRPADASRFMDIEFVDYETIDGRHECGVIAHKFQRNYPSLVIGEKDATEIRTIEITPAVTEQRLVTDAVLDENGVEITPAQYETVEIKPAVTEEREFPKYQQVNYIGLIPRIGTKVQQHERRIIDLEAKLEAALARIEYLEST